MKNIKIEIKWAIIFTLMMTLWMIMERAVGLHDKYIYLHPIYTNFVAIPAILIYVLALRDKKRTIYNGSMTYMEGFVCGLIMTVFITALCPLLQYVTSMYITPDYFKNAIAYSVEKKYMTQQAAAEYFNLKSYMIQATIGSFCMGLATTAIVAIFMRSKKKFNVKEWDMNEAAN